MPEVSIKEKLDRPALRVLEKQKKKKQKMWPESKEEKWSKRQKNDQEADLYIYTKRINKSWGRRLVWSFLPSQDEHLRAIPLISCNHLNGWFKRCTGLAGPLEPGRCYRTGRPCFLDKELANE